MKRNWKKAHPERAGESYETDEGLVRYDSLGRKCLIRKKGCAVCGKEFIPRTGFQKYCGAGCRAEGEKVTRECKQCGKEFRAIRSTMTAHCSSPCAKKTAAASRKGKKGRFGNGTPAPPIIKVCEICKQKFTAKSKHQPTCSKSCGSKRRAIKRRETLGTPPPWSIKSKAEEGCRNCGKFATHLHHIVPRSRCGPKGKRDLRNGVPLCFDCHWGWHHRRVVITRDKLTPDEEAFALELSDPVWMERNYPYHEADSFVMLRLTKEKQAELVRQAGGIEAAVAILQEVAEGEVA